MDPVGIAHNLLEWIWGKCPHLILSLMRVVLRHSETVSGSYSSGGVTDRLLGIVSVSCL